jgi:hypothetical protein
MPKSKGNWDHMKKWKTDAGYTFLAKDKEDAKLFVKKTGQHLGSLTEVVVEDNN